MKIIKNAIAKAKVAVETMTVKVVMHKQKMTIAVANNSGENYVDSAVKILIAVVLGGLLLAGLYTLFGDVVMPTLTRKIQEMFNYVG